MSHEEPGGRAQTHLLLPVITKGLLPRKETPGCVFGCGNLDMNLLVRMWAYLVIDSKGEKLGLRRLEAGHVTCKSRAGTWMGHVGESYHEASAQVRTMLGNTRSCNRIMGGHTKAHIPRTTKKQLLLEDGQKSDVTGWSWHRADMHMGPLWPSETLLDEVIFPLFG